MTWFIIKEWRWDPFLTLGVSELCCPFLCWQGPAIMWGYSFWLQASSRSCGKSVGLETLSGRDVRHMVCGLDLACRALSSSLQFCLWVLDWPYTPYTASVSPDPTPLMGCMEPVWCVLHGQGWSWAHTEHGVQGQSRAVPHLRLVCGPDPAYGLAQQTTVWYPCSNTIISARQYCWDSLNLDYQLCRLWGLRTLLDPTGTQVWRGISYMLISFGWGWWLSGPGLTRHVPLECCEDLSGTVLADAKADVNWCKDLALSPWCCKEYLSFGSKITPRDLSRREEPQLLLKAFGLGYEGLAWSKSPALKSVPSEKDILNDFYSIEMIALKKGHKWSPGDFWEVQDKDVRGSNLPPSQEE